MEILHTINLLNIEIPLENIEVKDIEKRNTFIDKTLTRTFPFLETKESTISQSGAIIYYLCEKNKSPLLGENALEKAKIMQWTEFANCEIMRCNRSIIYPVLGWDSLNKEEYNRDNNKLKEYLKLIENELGKSEYIIGNKITLADVALFAKLRFLMMFHFPEQMRKKLFPKTTTWFEKIMNSNEARKAYGRTVLCTTPLKPFDGKINKKTKENKNQEENEKEKVKENKQDKKEKEKVNKNEKKEKKGKKDKQNDKKDNKKDKKENAKKEEIKPEIKKEEPYVPSILEINRFNLKQIENNPLDSLPPSKFDLEKFKKELINSSDKKTSIDNFWKEFDSEGYSLWYIEYNNDPNECITLFRTCIIKGDILEQLKYFKKYCFGVLGAYGGDGEYKIKGCMLWRGNDIPQEIKSIHCFKKMTFKKLDSKNEKDQELVNEYWTKTDEKEKVCELPAADARYFY
jgi:elongation factor 1-gamma